MTVAAGSYGSLLENGFQILPHVQPGWRVDALAGAVSQLGTGCGMRNLLRTCPDVAGLARELRCLISPVLGDSAFPVRALFFDKTPDANWKVPWHQDFTIAVAQRVDAPGFEGWSNPH